MQNEQIENEIINVDITSVRKFGRLLGIPVFAGKSKDSISLEEVVWAEGKGMRLTIRIGDGRLRLWLVPPSDIVHSFRSANLLMCYEKPEIEGRSVAIDEKYLKRFFAPLAAKLGNTNIDDLRAMIGESPKPPPVQECGDLASFRKWGRPDQWSRFIADEAARRDPRDSLKIVNSITKITHTDFECLFVHNSESAGPVRFFNMPWDTGAGHDKKRDPKCGDENSSRQKTPDLHYTTDLNDMDIILGGTAKLRTIIDHVLCMDCSDVVTINTTCVPMVIGDDVEAELPRLREKYGERLIYEHQMSSPLGQYIELLNTSLAKHCAPKTKPDRHRLNLIGFDDNLARAELIDCLEQIGVSINVCLIPEIDLNDLSLYMNAATQVFIPNMFYGELYKQVFAGLPMKSIFPEAPYGFEGTWNWLGEVAEAAGRKKEFKNFRSENGAAFSERIETVAEKTGDRRLGFAIQYSQLEKLFDPSLQWGLPMTAMLEELGFGLDILVYMPEKSESEATGRRIMETLRRKDRHSVRFFESREELFALLSGGEFQAVYSDFFFDRRLTCSGKSQFSLKYFEMGFEGAERTARRLKDTCDLPFYRRYARYISGAPGGDNA